MPSAKETLPDPREMADDAVATMSDAASAQTAMLEQAMKVPQEMTRFCAHRMGRDMETMQALGRCRNPVDFMNVWTEAAQAAAEDYRTEMTRMMEMVSNSANVPLNGANGSSRTRKK